MANKKISELDAITSIDSNDLFVVVDSSEGETNKITKENALSGLQPTISNDNKISSDLVDDEEATNKFVTSSDITNWNGKQDTLSAGAGISISSNTISCTVEGAKIYYLEIDKINDNSERAKLKEIWDKVIINNNFDLAIFGEFSTGGTGRANSSAQITSYELNGQTYLKLTFNSIVKYDTIYSEYGNTFKDSYKIEIPYYVNSNDVVVFYNSSPYYSEQKFKIYYDYNNSSYPLAIGNTTSFTPSGDYNPATKKYVDDGLATKQDTLTAGSNITISSGTISATDTTYSSESASQGGTTLSLVTTGEKYTWNNKSDFSGDYTDLTNKPTIPDELADLTDDSTHRLVTDTEKTTWSGKQDALVSGTNIKTINNNSLLGSGDITISGGATYTAGDYIKINSNNVISGNVNYQGNVTSSSNDVGTSTTKRFNFTGLKKGKYMYKNYSISGTSSSNYGTFYYKYMVGTTEKTNSAQIYCGINGTDKLRWKYIEVEVYRDIDENIASLTDYTPLARITFSLHGGGSGQFADVAIWDFYKINPSSSNQYITGWETSLLTNNRTVKSALNDKQNKLVSGTNIKTINGTSLLGSGNIVTPNTTYTAGTGISIDANNVISATGGGGSSDFTEINSDVTPASSDFITGNYWYKMTNGAKLRIKDQDNANKDFYDNAIIYCYNQLTDEQYMCFVIIDDYGYHMYDYEGSSVTANTKFTDKSPLTENSLSKYIRVVDSITSSTSWGMLFDSPITIVSEDINITYNDYISGNPEGFAFPANSIIVGTMNELLSHSSKIMIYLSDGDKYQVTEGTVSSIHIERLIDKDLEITMNLVENNAEIQYGLVINPEFPTYEANPLTQYKTLVANIPLYYNAYGNETKWDDVLSNNPSNQMFSADLPFDMNNPPDMDNTFTPNVYVDNNKLSINVSYANDGTIDIKEDMGIYVEVGYGDVLGSPYSQNYNSGMCRGDINITGQILINGSPVGSEVLKTRLFTYNGGTREEYERAGDKYKVESTFVITEPINVHVGDVLTLHLDLYSNVNDNQTLSEMRQYLYLRSLDQQELGNPHAQDKTCYLRIWRIG